MNAFFSGLAIGALSLFAASTASATVVAQFDFDTDTEGFSSINVNGLGASGGSLVGTAATNDPQVFTSGLGLSLGAGETFSTLEFRVREFDTATNAFVASFNPIGVVVALNGGGGGLTFANTSSAVDSGDGFFTVTQDISALGAATLESFRFDPIGGAASNAVNETSGNGFEVDFVRINAVPEPASLVLVGLGGLALLARRRG